ncbi:MAG: transposase zinc-binding domain-containing protein [Holophaga sp.]|nr:transposase zinc-binding domain-containing protein [Holophaga sp.]
MKWPATSQRARLYLAKIARGHRPDLEQRHPPSKLKCRALSDITVCRIALMGGNRNACAACGWEEQAYGSCGNRNCPKCQALAQEHWIAAMAKLILPVLHIHLVFTLPSESRERCFPVCGGTRRGKDR